MKLAITRDGPLGLIRTSMTVFLVPVGAGRHALYCEVKETETEAVEPSPNSTWRDRMLYRFRTTVADAEAEREREELGETTSARKGGFGRFIVRKIAEAVAEQRLLWHLRRASEGRLVHPDDMSGDDAIRTARTEFAADYRKHLTRGIVNGSLSAVLGVVFFFIPGPNLVAYYFLFLAIGHYFALRGARRGLRGMSWSTESSGPLAEVRRAIAFEPAVRRATLERISTDLGLKRLWRFVERVARRPA